MIACVMAEIKACIVISDIIYLVILPPAELSSAQPTHGRFALVLACKRSRSSPELLWLEHVIRVTT